MGEVAECAYQTILAGKYEDSKRLRDVTKDTLDRTTGGETASKELFDNWGKKAQIRCDISFFYMAEKEVPNQPQPGGQARKQVVQLQEWSPLPSMFKRSHTTTKFQDILEDRDEEAVPASVLEEIEGIKRQHNTGKAGDDIPKLGMKVTKSPFKVLNMECSYGAQNWADMELHLKFIHRIRRPGKIEYEVEAAAAPVAVIKSDTDNVLVEHFEAKVLTPAVVKKLPERPNANEINDTITELKNSLTNSNHMKNDSIGRKSHSTILSLMQAIMGDVRYNSVMNQNRQLHDEQITEFKIWEEILKKTIDNRKFEEKIDLIMKLDCKIPKSGEETINDVKAAIKQFTPANFSFNHKNLE